MTFQGSIKELKLHKRLKALDLTSKEIWLSVQIYKDIRSTKILAHDLDLSVNTINSRLKSIYAKLGVRTRNQLIIKLVELMAIDEEIY